MVRRRVSSGTVRRLSCVKDCMCSSGEHRGRGLSPRPSFAVLPAARASVRLTVDGEPAGSYKNFSEPPDGGIVSDRVLTLTSARSLALKALEPAIRVRIAFDPASVRITQFRLMQGTYRPWRDAFRAALDGNARDADGRPIEGLMFPDGGGITLNHPTKPLSRVTYLILTAVLD